MLLGFVERLKTSIWYGQFYIPFLPWRFWATASYSSEEGMVHRTLDWWLLTADSIPLTV